ncbi:MAG TPA: GNAT family N-acetyltransferase [Thermoanaerobaculia bacterium]|nr:GNAT family N-acetyltransferase [Thermoanaerobaculia bacterium]
MTDDVKTSPVTNNKASSRFETEVDGHTAVAEYKLNDKVITFTHTEVPRELEGQGVAKRLIKTALDHARSEKLQVEPLCQFVSSYIKRHPEYEDLVSKG